MMIYEFFELEINNDTNRSQAEAFARMYDRYPEYKDYGYYDAIRGNEMLEEKMRLIGVTKFELLGLTTQTGTTYNKQII